METAIVIPVVAIVMLALVQVSLLVWDQLRVQHAAREGARVFVISNDAARARRAALDAAGLDPAHSTILISPSSPSAGEEARVTVSTTPPIIVPFMQAFTGSFTMRSEVVMLMERDP